MHDKNIPIYSILLCDMLMTLFAHYRTHILRAITELIEAGIIPEQLDLSRIVVEPPRDKAHGDLASNAALVLAKTARQAPAKLAALIAEKLRVMADFSEITIADPGFINMRLYDEVWRDYLRQLLCAGADYAVPNIGAGQPVNVEYVSANPTGPLHAAHGRGAVVGDVMANLLAKLGYAVTREYYINDAGIQVDQLARSAFLRYCEALGEDIGTIPSGLYPGEYLREVGVALKQRYGDTLRSLEESEWIVPVRHQAIEMMMAEIRNDLQLLGIKHDCFTSEQGLVVEGRVDAAFATLEAAGLIYTGVLEPPKGKPPEEWEPHPQILFRARNFGDDSDRVLKKSDGSWTYFATDIAYHQHKFARDPKTICPTMITVLGADHIGYVKRMQAAVTAITEKQGTLEALICQMVTLMENGHPVPMSKRAGSFVTLRDVIEAVGADVVRFIMLTRHASQPLDFDFTKVREQSRENPVFYVQYAHARICSVLRNAVECHPILAEMSDTELAAVDLSSVTDPNALELIKQLSNWPRQLESAATLREPHRIATYLYELAAAFHSLWSRGHNAPLLRFIDPDDKNRTCARLALLRGVALILASGLQIIGVKPVEEMQ